MGKNSRPNGRRRTRARRQFILPMIWAVLVVASTAGALAPTALAAASATTGHVTNLTSTSATLNGTVTADSGGANWFFQYGTSPAYGQMTAAQPVPGGTSNVSVNVTGLMPATTYHYRIAVNGGAYSPDTFGADETFTTPAAPGTIATTGQATSVTATSAVLNGVADPSEAGSTWQFQYGTSTAYGHSTTMTEADAGLDLVSTKVTGLKPQTTYHFRLVVKQPGAPGTSNGQDSTFRTTAAVGTAHLRRHHLTVRRHRAHVPFQCTGSAGAPCRGKVSLSIKRGSGQHARRIACGSARIALAAPHNRTVSVKLRKRCTALLSKARHHSLGARLRAVFTTDQRPLSTGVRLIGR
jgi:phosphodiesterase/alkaline phosphatase D-like protein